MDTKFSLHRQISSGTKKKYLLSEGAVPKSDLGPYNFFENEQYRLYKDNTHRVSIWTHKHHNILHNKPLSLNPER